MNRRKYLSLFLFAVLCAPVAIAQKNNLNSAYSEKYRPEIHFSPKTGWMNDPNGMIYHKGIYHLFFQYYPDSTVWGPMHWGHATSEDLFHWKEQTIALYPDNLGYIFSGSAVLDKYNTTGLGTKQRPPLIAIFTHHDPVGEKNGKNNFQVQSLAYSVDDGKTWKKYEHNPVLKNPGITDFRDPKVMWYEEGKKWIMTLAIKDHIGFYSSPDLKNWKQESEFGKEQGAHGGVWECPDLFSLNYQGKKIWILIVNINPGGPNAGSATQYFVGHFDGNKFSASHTDTRWLDYGPDEYAGVLWSNVGSRRIFFGWMSNWLYGQQVPTQKWRSAMTIPRELRIQKAGDGFYLSSTPSPEIKNIQAGHLYWIDLHASKPILLRDKVGSLSIPCEIQLQLDTLKSFAVRLSNSANEEVLIGYDKSQNQFYIDRTKSGITGFEKNFAGRHVVPRFSHSDKINLTLVIDVASVELFGDDGLSVMTEIFFPTKPFDQIHLQSTENATFKKVDYWQLKSIWK